MKEFLTKMAVKWLTKELRKDKGLFNSYQANIAMSVYDSISSELHPLDKDKYHKLCNDGATNFMKMWINN